MANPIFPAFSKVIDRILLAADLSEEVTEFLQTTVQKAYMEEMSSFFSAPAAPAGTLKLKPKVAPPTKKVTPKKKPVVSDSESEEEVVPKKHHKHHHSSSSEKKPAKKKHSHHHSSSDSDEEKPKKKKHRASKSPEKKTARVPNSYNHFISVWSSQEYGTLEQSRAEWTTFDAAHKQAWKDLAADNLLPKLNKTYFTTIPVPGSYKKVKKSPTKPVVIVAAPPSPSSPPVEVAPTRTASKPVPKRTPPPVPTPVAVEIAPQEIDVSALPEEGISESEEEHDEVIMEEVNRTSDAEESDE